MARKDGDAFVLNGSMPWVTGASRADFLITGAVLEDRGQVLLVLPRTAAGVSVGPTLDLMALEGSLTAEVRCNHVRVEAKWLLAGPAEQVMASGRGGTGGLETSTLALGLTRSAIDYLDEQAKDRPELQRNASQLRHAFQLLWGELRRAAETGCPASTAAALRARANALVLRATQMALTASKGSGFVRSHPAQRWARQALFFLVWSCPRPAVEATMAYLAPPLGPACS
jgi:alkylation response protein AidB-like acyl-CoA dehydrogenase